ncbi:MAG TPA: ABC transporter substrate-binding protein [Nitrolancea sp.]|nr:ABC transporter substrate-binding protein [Nitrolancea sp.]
MESNDTMRPALGGTKLSRRSVTKLLAGAAGAPLLGTLIAACGGSSSNAPSATSGSGGTSNATTIAGLATPMNTFQNMATPAATPAAASTTTSAATPQAAAGTPKKGGTIHMSIINDPDTLDPVLSSSATSSSIFTYIYDSLVYIGQDHLPHPWLAEKWDINTDGTQITFTIRQGIQFHDGTPLDGAAVQAYFDRVLDPKLASIRKTGMGPMTGVDLVDPMTVRCNFSQPYAPFFTQLDGNGITSPAAVQKFGDKFGHNPVGTGPFKFKEWPQGQSVSLVRYENYKNYRDEFKNKGAPYVDGLSWKIIAEQATSTAALLSGELDIAGVDLTQAPTIMSNPQFQVYIWKDRNGYIFVEYNMNKAPFSDLAVRKAVAYALDRDSIVKSAWNGFATVDLLPIPTGVAGYDASLNQFAYPYDPTKAKQALTDGGYAPGSDGIMAKDGKPLSFTMIVYSGYDALKTAGQIVQSNLKAVGMDCKIQVMDFGAELPLLNAGNFDCDLMRWTSSDPTILSLMFKTPGWTKQMHDKDLDALLTKADTTLDPQKRLDAVHDAIKYLLAQAIVAPICVDWSMTFVHKYVKDYSLTVFGRGRLEDVWLDK